MTRHIPILKTAIIDALTESPRHSGTWIDCTFGGGGHSSALLERLEEKNPGGQYRVIGIDRDPDVHRRAREKFAAALASGHLELRVGDFATVLKDLDGESIRAQGILADLGFSSDQVDQAERGLSFMKEGPIDMRLNPEEGESAWDLLMSIGEKELADLLFQLGEERHSRRIARLLVNMREGNELKNSTLFLAEAIRRGYPPGERHGSRIHPATRSFQALRIAVNDELGQLDQLLTVAPAILAPGGRLAVLSFHSLEDRRVKVRFKGQEDFQSLWKKPLEAGEEEIEMNPRSRSAKLRVIERLA